MAFPRQNLPPTQSLSGELWDAFNMRPRSGSGRGMRLRDYQQATPGGINPDMPIGPGNMSPGAPGMPGYEPPFYPPPLQTPPGQPSLSGWPQLPYPPGHLPGGGYPPTPRINTTPVPPGTPYPTFPSHHPMTLEHLRRMRERRGDPPYQKPTQPFDPTRPGGIPADQYQLMREHIMDKYGPDRYHSPALPPPPWQFP